ncbi:hypothetical protein BpHYR1_017416, partial [Brachionus plicatilis]
MSMLIESKNLTLSEVSSIEQAIESNKHLDSKINEIIKSNHTIDVSLAMKNLATVGKILNLAYAGSKGFKCSTSTIKILSKYQSMIHNSYLACSTFVSECFSSLKQHRCAIILAEKDDIKEALAVIEKCSESASEMVKTSGELANQADELCKLSEEALIAASEDESVSQQEKRRIADLIRDSKARQVELEAKTSSLFKQIDEIQEEKQKINRKIDQKANLENTQQIFSFIFSFFFKFFPTTGQNNNDEDQKRLYQKEKEVSAFKRDLEEAERVSNAEITKIVAILRELTIQDQGLKASIKSLELAIKSLGKIKTTFELTRQFWIGVLNHCKQLSDFGTIKSYAKAELKDEVIDELRLSGLQWLSLGKLNYIAKEAIEKVSKQADHLLNNLPTKSEALRLVQDE